MKLARCRVVAVTFSAFIAILYSLHANALGLGELTLNSGLNQPLDATIELLQTDGLDASEIRIQLGSQQDFQRANMERTTFLLGIEFDVEILDSNNALLHLTSSTPVIEPYLSFILDARWPSGRMLREYTALIDLPVLSRTPAEPAQAPLASQDQTEPEQQPEPQQQMQRAEEAQAESTENDESARESAVAESLLTEAESDESPDASDDSPVSPETAEAVDDPLQADTPPAVVSGADETLLDPDTIDEEYTVSRDDTLWEIALQTRPNSTISVNQMMLAIQRENPDAFISDNINLVREGAVLRVPLVGQIMSMPLDLAEVEVTRQNREFSADLQPLVAGSGNAGTASAQNDELSIISGEDVALGEGGSLEESIASLEMQLMLSEENLDRARIENQELSARLSEVDSQIELLDNIIDIESQRMAELQAELSAQAESEALEAADAAQGPDQSSEEVALTDAQPATAPAPTGIVGQLRQWLENPLMLGGILAALILLVVGMLVLRRRRAEEDMEDDFEPVFANMNQGSDAALRGELDERSQSDEFVADAQADEETEDFDDLVGSLDIDENDDDNEGFEEDRDDDDDDSDEGDDEDDDDDDDGINDTDDSDNLDEDDEYYSDDEDDEKDDDDDESSGGKNSGILSSLGALMGNFSRRRRSADAEVEKALDEGISDGFGEQGSPQTPELEESAAVVASQADEPEANEPDVDEATSHDLPETVQSTDANEDLNDDQNEGQDDFDKLIAEADRLTGFESEAASDVTDYAETGADTDIITEESTAEESITKESVAEDENEDDDAFVEFNLAAVNTPAADENNEQSHAPDEDEVFDFKLDDDFTSPDGQELTEDSEEPEDELETFDFTVPGQTLGQGQDKTTDDDPAGDVREEPEEPEESGTEDDDIFDLGDLSFDEDDAEDDDESEQEGLLEIDGESSRIDLAVAYEAMGDLAGARQILEKVLAEGDEREQKEARKLLGEWSDAK